MTREQMIDEAVRRRYPYLWNGVPGSDEYILASSSVIVNAIRAEFRRIEAEVARVAGPHVTVWDGIQTLRFPISPDPRMALTLKDVRP